MRRVAKIAVALVALACLTGCEAKAAESKVSRLAAMKVECEASGGAFETWWDDFFGTRAMCDLSTDPKK